MKQQTKYGLFRIFKVSLQGPNCVNKNSSRNIQMKTLDAKEPT